MIRPIPKARAKRRRIDVRRASPAVGAVSSLRRSIGSLAVDMIGRSSYRRLAVGTATAVGVVVLGCAGSAALGRGRTGPRDGRHQTAFLGTRTTRRFGSSPIDCVTTS